MKAYCYASGRIAIGKNVPDGALPIARGPRNKLREMLSGTARHTFDSRVLLVPGIPEAPSQSYALDALKRYTKWIAKHAPEGVEIFYSAHRIRRKPPTIAQQLRALEQRRSRRPAP